MNLEDSPLRLLVVDDDELDRETVRRALMPMRAEIMEATSGREAEGRLKDHSFDCVLLDYLLPEGPSLELIDYLREHAPHTALVVLTGQGDEAVAVELMKAGAADYLSKDALEPSRLRAAITFAVALRRAQIGAARAKAERDHYAGQLRRFVERAPELVAARTLEALCDVAASIAVDVLNASESLVVLRGVEQELQAFRGDGERAELHEWVKNALAENKMTGPQLRPPEMADDGLMARDGA
jgi:DNA-binding NtrC family response regulator